MESQLATPCSPCVLEDARSHSSRSKNSATEKQHLIVDDASIQRMKQLEREQQKEARRRRRRPPPLTSSSSSLSSLCSVESETTPFGNIRASNGEFCCEIPLTTTLPILVFLDMFSVALVVPLLFRYYQEAGVTSAGQRELITSVFSLAQVVGGLVLGALIDARWIKRRTVLFLSFGGSAFAYALIAVGGFAALVCSRTLVGLVKQTMTITKTMLTRCTTEENRALHMGRLSASATAAWVVGPSMGAVLFKYVDSRAPPMLASALFLANMAIARWVLPVDDENNDHNDDEDHLLNNATDLDESNNSTSRKLTSCPRQCKTATYKATNKCQTCTISFVSNLKSCFSSSTLGSVVCASLVVTWVTRATNSNNLSSFYEDLYGLEPHHRGYISSYQQVLGFFIESCFIAPVLRWSGGERRATCLYAFLLAMSIGLQTIYPSSLNLFLGLVCPMTSLAYSIMFTSLQTLVTTVAPVESIFSVLAAMDVLQNMVSVTVPFYRTVLFAQLTVPAAVAGGGGNQTHTTTSSMEGDPDARAWLLSCTVQWFISTAALVCFLLWKESRWDNQNNKGNNNNNNNGRGATPKKTS